MSSSRPGANLVAIILGTARTHPLPPKPLRPFVCPACRSDDIHGIRPCVHRPDLERHPELADHDWHCHACRWSAQLPRRR